MIESVRVSPAARDQLITLKRRTGITHWNELCRWAVCRSLGESTPPADVPISVEDGIEMSWRTFAGPHGDLYLGLIRHRCALDGLDTDDIAVARYLRLHLHRGIGYLFGDAEVNSIRGLLRLVDARRHAAEKASAAG
ncbi:MAG: DNA sulfur modification protein DndE [Dehalococcoidia bacterium]